MSLCRAAGCSRSIHCGGCALACFLAAMTPLEHAPEGAVAPAKREPELEGENAHLNHRVD